MGAPGSSEQPARSPRRGPGPGSRNLLPVGRFFGVPLYFAPSWLIIAALITLTYAEIIAAAVPGLGSGMSYLLAFGYAVLLALSILLHELGHVAVSLALGNPVSRVVIFLLGGVSEIEREPRRARDEFLVSIAGPLVSLALAALAYWGYRSSTPSTVLWVTLGLLAFSNVLVGGFNLLPGLPLDGGRVLRSVVWGASGRRLTGTQVAAWAGRVVAVLFVLTMLWLSWDVRSIGSIVFAFLLGAFIWIGAGQSLRVAQLQARVPALRVTDLVRPAVSVPAGTPLAEALRRTWDHGARAIVVVDPAGAAAAIVEEARVATVPVARRPWVPVSDVARALQPGVVLPETLEGETLLEAVQTHPAGEYLVVRVDGTTVGVLSAADIASHLSGAGSGAGHGPGGPGGPAGPAEPRDPAAPGGRA